MAATESKFDFWLWMRTVPQPRSSLAKTHRQFLGKTQKSSQALLDLLQQHQKEEVQWENNPIITPSSHTHIITMPLRIQHLSRLSLSSATTISSRLTLTTQPRWTTTTPAAWTPPAATTSGVRFASILNQLSDVPGAYNKRIRRGRGPGSGKGKTSGRGHGGQKQKGKVPFGLTGGQTKEEKVKGSRGFTNMFVFSFSPAGADKKMLRDLPFWSSDGGHI
jgi:hypothetical protein